MRREGRWWLLDRGKRVYRVDASKGDRSRGVGCTLYCGGGGGGGDVEPNLPTAKIKFLVGKGRATAKGIEQEFGVKLHIPKPDQQKGTVTAVGLEAPTQEAGIAAQGYVSSLPNRRCTLCTLANHYPHISWATCHTPHRPHHQWHLLVIA